MNIYVSNLDNAIDNEGLKELFAPFGEVNSAEGVSRGFGYVDMEDEAAKTAIRELNQTVLHTLTITVEEAPEKKALGSYKVGSGPVSAYRFRKK